jgi:ribosomal protein S27E
MATRQDYCEHCEQQTHVYEDEPWLPAVCETCGRNVAT